MVAVNMSDFDCHRPFTKEDALNFEGAKVAVKLFDSGLSRICVGVLSEITDTTIKVGDEVLLNECVRKVTFKD